MLLFAEDAWYRPTHSMSDLRETLNELPTFRALQDAEAEFETLKTPDSFNVDDSDHLTEQLERVRQRDALGIAALQGAFQREVATSSLPLTERLAVLAAYDPATLQRQHEGQQRAQEEIRRSRGSTTSVALLGYEGLRIPLRVNNAEIITKGIRNAHDFAQQYAGERIAMRVTDDVVITGRLPEDGLGYITREPRLNDGKIEYSVPFAFQNIRDLRLYDSGRGVKHELKNYPHLVADNGEELEASPHINEIRQALGYRGVNIYRGFYFNSFKDAIVGGEDGVQQLIRALHPKTSDDEDEILSRRLPRRRTRASAAQDDETLAPRTSLQRIYKRYGRTLYR